MRNGASVNRESLHSFSASLASVARFLDREGDLEVEKIRRVWLAAAGSSLAEHATPLRLNGSALIVAADSSASKAAVSLASRKIIAELIRQGFSVGEVRVELRTKHSQRKLMTRG